MTSPWVFGYVEGSLTRGSSAASRWRFSANPLRKNLGEKLGSNPLHAAEHGSSNQGAKRTPWLAERRLPGASDGQNSASLDGVFSDRGGLVGFLIRCRLAERVGLSSTDLPDARNPINKGLLAAGENRCVPPVCTTFRGLRQASWLSWRPAVAAAQQDDGFGGMVPSRGLDYFSRASALRQKRPFLKCGS
jgi:hypothetical protein